MDESSNKQRLIINANASLEFTIKYWPVLVLKSTLVIKKFQRDNQKYQKNLLMLKEKKLHKGKR